MAAFITVGSAGAAADNEPEPHVHLFGQAGIVLSEIVRGAMLRLERPECARIIGELQDDLGRPLAWNLSERNMDPPRYLAELRFLEGDELQPCSTESTVAVTMPHSRVIWVCGRRFSRYFSLRRPLGEAVIIHELLHSLGLQEDPPSSLEITQMVSERCGN